MGSKSKSSTRNTSKNFNIVNNNTGDGGGGGGNALTDNLNAMESELTFGDITTIQSDQGAIEAGRDLGMTALSVGAENTRLAYEDVGESRDWAGNIASGAVDNFQSTTEMALQRNSEAMKNALSFARDSERSEGGLTIEAVAPYGMGVVALLIIYMMFYRGGK